MTEGERLFVRVDATLETGLGHFTRCLAIGQCWRESIGPVTFIGQYTDALRTELEEDSIDVVSLPTACPDPQDIATTTEQIPERAPVILDGYHFESTYQERLAKDRRLLVIDDLGDLEAYAGSILLNANVYADEIDYRHAPSQRLLGLRYALLRREFREARSAASARLHELNTLLVCLGGADAANDTLTVLRALRELSLSQIRIRVIVGPLNPHADALERFAESDDSVQILRNPDDMCAELLAADFVIAGAGTISAELACLGKPSLLMAVADNQLSTGPRMEQAGAAIYAGDLRELDFSQLMTTIAEALSDTSAHDSMRARGPTLVDGRGAVRICSLLSGAPDD